MDIGALKAPNPQGAPHPLLRCSSQLLVELLAGVLSGSPFVPLLIHLWHPKPVVLHVFESVVVKKRPVKALVTERDVCMQSVVSGCFGVRGNAAYFPVPEQRGCARRTVHLGDAGHSRFMHRSHSVLVRKLSYLVTLYST